MRSWATCRIASSNASEMVEYPQRASIESMATRVFHRPANVSAFSYVVVQSRTTQR